MQSYFDLLEDVLSSGIRQPNRTGIDTLSLPGASMRFDMENGFPLLTARTIPYRSIFAELVGFLQCFTSAKQFREIGTKIWDANANENKAWLASPFRLHEDDLGFIYGCQWRDWQATSYEVQTPEQAAWFRANGWAEVGNGTFTKAVDQMQECLDLLRKDPTSRRILFHGWNPAALHDMALPPCHLLYQFHVHGRRLSLTMYIRSNDLGLGAPFNIASGATLLHIFANAAGFEPWRLTVHIGDAHIYVDHIEALTEMLATAEYPVLPRLRIVEDLSKMDMADIANTLTPDTFVVEGYAPLKINSKMRMAV